MIGLDNRQIQIEKPELEYGPFSISHCYFPLSGNDPDKVAESADGSLPEPVPPAASLPKVSPGSIQPLLEKSRCMVEIKGVTLNKSQVGWGCLKYINRKMQSLEVFTGRKTQLCFISNLCRCIVLGNISRK